MRNAHDYHHKAVDLIPADGTLRCTIYSYSIECGIKATIMKERGYKSTADFRDQDKLGTSGHDIRQGLTILKAGNDVKKLLIDAKTDQPQPQNVHPEAYHQAARYGIRLKERDQVEKNLVEVQTWVKIRLNKA